MAPRKGSSPFSRVKSPLLDANKQWYVLNSSVCGDRPPKFLSRNKFPARFPDDFKRVKRSGIQTLDGGPFRGKASSEDEIVASSFGLIATFLRHATDSKVFEEEPFNRLKDFLNSLDLSFLSADHDGSTAVQSVDNLAHVVVSTPVAKVKTKASRRLAMPSPSSSHALQSAKDEDTGCSLLTPPSTGSKKVSGLVNAN